MMESSLLARCLDIMPVEWESAPGTWANHLGVLADLMNMHQVLWKPARGKDLVVMARSLNTRQSLWSRMKSSPVASTAMRERKRARRKEVSGSVSDETRRRRLEREGRKEAGSG
jgi:hypothetical protein